MKWMTSVTKTEIIEKTPDMVGTTFIEYLEEDGRGTEMRGIITEFVPNKRISFHLNGNFNSVSVSFNLEEKTKTTILTQNADIEFKGITKIIILLFGNSFKNQIKNQSQNEFANLKELCEMTT